ncbi:hypothetical protein DXU84_25080, partial [Rahnella sp. RcJ3]|nr:hypothetical protein [Rahnella sp. RcJ3]
SGHNVTCFYCEVMISPLFRWPNSVCHYNPGFSLAEDTDDLFVGKTLLHGDVLMWLMKTLLTSWCINQRGAGQR